MKPIESTNGEISATISGKPYFFKFGMLAAKLLEKHGSDDTTNIEMMVRMLWAGLMCRFEQNQLTNDFSVDSVYDLIDEMSDEDLAQVLAVSRTAFDRLPNVGARVNGLLGLDENGKPLPTGKPSR